MKRKKKNVDNKRFALHKKTRILQHQHFKQAKMYISLFLFHHLNIQSFLDAVTNQASNQGIIYLCTWMLQKI